MNSLQRIAQNNSLLHVLILLCVASWSLLAHAQSDEPLKRAEQAVLRAESADADQYAWDMIESARQTLMEAQRLIVSSRRSERNRASGVAERAAVDADLAYAHSMKAKIDADLQYRRNEVARLQTRLETLTSENRR